jgi:predicted glycosyltransferase
MYRSNNLDDIINKALSFIVSPNEHINVNHDDLFKLVLDNIYDLGKNGKQ